MMTGVNWRNSLGTRAVLAALLLPLLVAIVSEPADAAALTATASPATCVNVGGIGTQAWSNAGNAVSSNASWASASVNDGQTTQYLQCTGYGFALPANAIVDGITVAVERSANNTGSIRDAAMRLVKAGTIQANDRSTATLYGLTDTYENHGGAADLWGTTWTAADINNAGFGAAFAAVKPGTAGGNITTYVDHMQISVAYRVPPSVVSINRASFDPTYPNKTVTWTVVFSEAVIGVDAGDFALVQSAGASGASITSVTGSGTTWTVTANTGTSAGTLRLNLVDNDTITGGGFSLGGSGAGNGNFSGQAYTILATVCTPGLIFCDDFERSNPSAVGNGWTVTPGAGTSCTGTAGNSGCAGIDSDIPPWTTYANPRANATRAMFTRWGVVSVDSPVINLAGRPGAQLTFWMRRGGDSFSEYPELAGENYLVRYKDASGVWQTLAQYPSGVMQGQVFTPTIELPPEALHANFQLRFYQPSGSGSVGSGGAAGVVGYDYWHLDDVVIREQAAPSFVGAFCDNFEGGLGRWSISAEGAPGSATIGDSSLSGLTYQSASNSLALRWGYVSAATFKTDLVGVTGDITYWVRSGTTTTRDPDTNENLVVEYKNAAGNWINLATYLGSAAAGTIYSGNHPIPADAKHAGFRLRFRMLAGSGHDADYWHVDDVCVGDPLPTADLAITKTRSGALIPGNDAVYTINVINNGPGTLAGSVEVVDTLPAGLTYVGSTGTNWTCSANNQVVTCNWSGTLVAGSSPPTLTLNTKVNTNASGTLTNSATVSGTVADNVPGNNTATESGSVFAPSYVFTDGPCTAGVAFGTGGQCNLVWPDNGPAWVAGTTSNPIYITAVNAANVPTALSTTSATTINLRFALSCHDPEKAAGIKATFSAVGELPLCAEKGVTPSTWSSAIAQTFPMGSPSAATGYSFSYADVGKIEFYMQNSAATTQMGSSGPFVMKPYTLVVTDIKRPPSLDNPGASNGNGTRFVRAGEAFSATVTSLNSSCSGNVATYSKLSDIPSTCRTPNFGKEATATKVFLENALVAGLDLINNPDLNNKDAFGSFTGGSASGSTFSWPEVGIIRLTPKIVGGKYLDTEEIATLTTSGNVGRFYPDHYDTVVYANSGVPMPCPTGVTCPGAYPGLAYSAQPFPLRVMAKNAAGDNTRNYHGTNAFAKAVTLEAKGARGGDTAPSSPGTLSVTTIAANQFNEGQAEITLAYAFNPVLAAPAQVFVRASHSADDVTSLRGGSSVEGGVAVAKGRLKLSSVFGSEKVTPLRMPVQAQIWNGQTWVINNQDTTTIPGAALAFSGLALNNPGNVTLAGGNGTFNLSQTVANAIGSTDVAINLGGTAADSSCLGAHPATTGAGLPWFRSKHGSCPAATNYLSDPSARATFGIFAPESTKAIHVREMY